MTSLALTALLISAACAPNAPDGASSAPLPAKQAPALRTVFGVGSVRVLTERGPALVVELGAWGREFAVDDAFDGPSLTDCGGACAPRMEYARGSLRSWWRGLDHGLQQGWDLDAPPPGSGPLALELRVPGARTDGVTVWLADEAGPIWRVAGLFAFDAENQPLDAWFEPRDDGFAVRVDDTGARYPLRIDPLYTTAGSTLTGTVVSSQFGYAVAGAGDVNGDGYSDVIVGAPFWSSNIGRAYVFLGGAGGVSTTPATTLTGAGTGYYFGVSVAALGDVNGDGFDDVAIGASGAVSSTGKVFVHFGSSSGVGSTSSAEYVGPSTGAYFGHSVAGGDFNGDGFGDLAIGAYGFNSNTGRVTIYHGASAGLPTTANHTLSGASTAHQFGRVIARAGDVNNDGYDDLIAGAPGYAQETGAAYVFHGSTSGLSTVAARTLIGASTSNFYGSTLTGGADFNGDGYDDVAVGAYGYMASLGRVEVYNGGNGGIPQSSTVVLNGTLSGGEFGRSVAAAGDVDGDGYGDLLVGTDSYLSNTGSLDIFFGDAANLSSRTGGQISGASALDYFGCALSAAGDVDGDGFDDVIVGARGTTALTGSAYVFHGYADEDGDGYSSLVDCDDTNSRVNPGATEICDASQTDEDCNGLADDDDAGVTGTSSFWADLDNDGYGDPNTVISACQVRTGLSIRDGDCNDTDPNINAGATEVCDPNDVDEDCDRFADDLDSAPDAGTMTNWYPDADSDGFGATTATPQLLCDAPSGWLADASDCDDLRADVSPLGVEVCDDLDTDEDCDGMIDDADTVDSSSLLRFYADADGDGYGDPNAFLAGCDPTPERLVDDTDCDDGDPAINPAAVEVCDDQDVDENCNGLADDADYTRDVATTSTWYEDRDSDGFGNASVALKACDQPSGHVVDDQDCDDDDPTIHPGATEDCAVNIDFNCDGSVGYADADGDDHPACLECDDSNAAINPDAAEVCDGVDNDCDGQVDDEDPSVSGQGSYYVDADGDGYGDAHAEALSSCAQPSGYVTDATDCDDADPLVYPGAAPDPTGAPRDCVATPARQLSGGCGCAQSGAGGGAVAALLAALGLARRRQGAPLS